MITNKMTISYDTRVYLRKEIVDKLVEAGVDMSDSEYLVLENFGGDRFVSLKTEIPEGEYAFMYPTYTLPEILKKLPEKLRGVFNGIFGDNSMYTYLLHGNWETKIMFNNPLDLAAELLIGLYNENYGRE